MIIRKDIIAKLDESIKLELYAADLYFLFSMLFSADSSFWWKLLLEEQGHASLIRSGKEIFEPIGAFPHDMLAPVLNDIIEANTKLDYLIKSIREISISREEAFNIAFEVETSAGELHFQNFFDKKTDSRIDEIFKKLIQDDHDHAKRISSYMNRHDIPLQLTIR